MGISKKYKIKWLGQFLLFKPLFFYAVCEVDSVVDTVVEVVEVVVEEVDADVDASVVVSALVVVSVLAGTYSTV